MNLTFISVKCDRTQSDCEIILWYKIIPLRAFMRRLKAEGVNYNLGILSKERFNKIISPDNSCGNEKRKGKGKGGCCNN